MINWKVRIRNKMFWLALIPAVLVLVKEVLELFGVAFDPELISAQLTGLIETVFLIKYRYTFLEYYCLHFSVLG